MFLSMATKWTPKNILQMCALAHKWDLVRKWSHIQEKYGPDFRKLMQSGAKDGDQ